MIGKQKMKHSSYILWLLLVAGLSACLSFTAQDRISDDLSRAAGWMWTAPDSALHLLKSFPHPEKLTGREQADYALLLSHARYRCYIASPSDSLADIAVAYYKDKNDMDKKGRAWYVKGAVCEERGNETQAVSAYKKAESCIPGMKDLHTVSHIYSSLGYINKASRNYELAQSYFQKALQLDECMADIHSQASHWVNLFGLYRILDKKDSLDRCIERLGSLLPAITDSVLLAQVCHNIGIYRQEAGDEVQAEELFLRALRLTPQNPPYRTLAQLSMLYARTGREALADSLFLRLEHIPDLSVRAGLYDAKYREHLAKEEYREAIRYAGLYRAVADSFYTNRRNKEIQEIQAEHDRMEMLYRNARLKNNRQLILLLSVCAVTMLVYTFGRYKQKSLRQYARLQAEITLLQETFARTNEENARTHESETDYLRRQIAQKMEEIDKLKGMEKRIRFIVGSYGSKDLDNLYCMQVILRLMESRTCNLPQDRPHLTRWLNLSKDHLADRLQAAFPAMKERLSDTCLLASLGMSVEEIAGIMQVDVRTVEHYMADVCRYVRFNEKGKKGFLEFLKAFSASKA